jgi:uncharacterized protein (TIGR02271 family)
MASKTIPNNEVIPSRGCVAGLFRDDAHAESAIEKLKKAGFSQTDIGVATAGGRDTGQHEGLWNKMTGLFGKREHPEPAPEVEDSLLSCGLDRQQAHYFDQALFGGEVLLTIRSSGDRAIEARRIMQEAGADLGMGKIPDRPATAPVEGERRIQLLGEILRVHKERVQRGEVRLHKEVVTETQHVEVPVSREELVIERTPGQGREATSPIGSEGKGIRVPLSEERVRVEKKPVVNEEVRVGKEKVEHTERVDDTVRHEELRTDRQGNVDVKDKGKKAA